MSTANARGGCIPSVWTTLGLAPAASAWRTRMRRARPDGPSFTVTAGIVGGELALALGPLGQGLV